MPTEELAKVRITIASSSDLKYQALRLRYCVFHDELARTEYARREQRIYTDVLDDTVAGIIVAIESNRTVVATLRFTLGRDSAFLPEDEAGFADLFDHLWARNEIALVDRGAIDPSHRGRELYHALWDFLEHECRALGVRILIGVIDANNERLCNFHLKRGWSIYRDGIRESGHIWNYITKIL
jgi:GNAT superfamily N-acetyltransferase